MDELTPSNTPVTDNPLPKPFDLLKISDYKSRDWEFESDSTDYDENDKFWVKEILPSTRTIRVTEAKLEERKDPRLSEWDRETLEDWIKQKIERSSPDSLFLSEFGTYLPTWKKV
jgi:hypothetical protein